MKDLGTPELYSMLRRGEKLSLINVLSQKQFRVTQIPGSANVPLADGDFEEKVEQQVGGKDKTVVVYCADSACEASSEAAARLEAAGFTDVYNYTGGAKAWQAAGGILITPTAENCGR